MNSKTILAFLLMLLIGGSQIGYFVTIHKENKLKVEEIRRDIATKQDQVTELKKQLEVLPQTKEELLKLDMKVTSLRNKIPSYSASSRAFSDMIRIMQTSNFLDVAIKVEEIIEHTYEEEVFLECLYSLTYIAPFTQSRDFVNALNQSEQLLNISSFKVDNMPQIEEKKQQAYKYLYGEGFKELVKTELKFSAFVNPKSIEEEIYDPSINILRNTENAFLNVEGFIKPQQEGGAGEYLDVEEDEGIITLPSTSEQQVITKFKISISDILTSGDNYSFVGPSTDQEATYAGFAGHQTLYITLTIRSDNYNVSMETEDGHIVQNGAAITSKNPHLDVFSTMKPIAEEMPKVYIYVNNYTQDLGTVRLEGSLLENIMIYNGSGERVAIGETKGNIKVY